MPLKIRVDQNDESVAVGSMALNHCPYATFCRELISSEGKAALLGLEKGPATVTFTVQPGISRISLETIGVHF